MPECHAILWDFHSMKTIILAAVALATGASADAAVTFNFAGTEFGGAFVSGTLTIDTDALIGANGAVDPALSYYFATGDGSSTAASPFLSVSFSSAGSNPTLFSAGWGLPAEKRSGRLWAGSGLSVVQG